MLPTIIAEIKTQSPFGFKSPHSFHHLMELAIEHGDWVSVHTNALWGGDFEAISFVRRNTKKPILAKGFHASDDDIHRAINHGADYVLVVDRLPAEEFREYCILECSLKWMKDWMYWADKFLYNSRDLATGLRRQPDELHSYVAAQPKWLCQASGLKSPLDIHPMVDACLVGEHLVEFCKELQTC